MSLLPKDRPESQLTKDCNIFHSVMFSFSVVCVCLVSVVMGGLAAAGHVEKEIAGRWVASTCATWACLLTLYLVYLHCVFYRNPLEQRCIVRILIMVIVYAVDSFCGLLWHEQAVWIGAVRDSYEAYVIFSFFTLLMHYLDGPDTIVRHHWQGGTKTLDHPPPMCCLKPCKLNRSTLNWWEFFTLQYAVINPLLALVTVIIWFSDRDLYEEGHMAVANSYPWIAGIRFISVTFAFTALVYFYLATKEYMAAKKPTSKFVAIKIIVFFSFWQSVALSGLSHFGVIKPTKFWSSDSIATGAANFLLCVQMWMVAVAHKWAFSHEPYAEMEPNEDEEDNAAEDGISWCPRWAVLQDIFLCRDAAEQFRTIVGNVNDELGDESVKFVNKLDRGVDKIADGAKGIASAAKENVVKVFKNDGDGSKKSTLSVSSNASPPSAAAAATATATAADVDDDNPKEVVTKQVSDVHET